MKAYRVIPVEDKETKKQLEITALNQKFISEAPLVLVFWADHNASAGKYGQRGSELYCIQDATIAAAYSQLIALSLGLGSCWVGAFNPFKVNEILKIESDKTPVAMITIGYENNQ